MNRTTGEPLKVLAWECEQCGKYLPFPRCDHYCGVSHGTAANPDMQQGFQIYCEWIVETKSLHEIELVICRTQPPVSSATAAGHM
jgi:hypothetical protein